MVQQNFFFQWTTSMKNRILCNIFLYYQDFLHHSVKIGSDVFIYKTTHTSFLMFKNKTTSLQSTLHCYSHTYCQQCQQITAEEVLCVAALSQPVPMEHNLWTFKPSGICQSVGEQAVPDIAKDLLTQWHSVIFCKTSTFSSTAVWPQISHNTIFFFNHIT
jgi:hypothetical protein